MTNPTTFVLGAGFSVEQQFPLVRGLKERVVHFLEAERHASYEAHLRPCDVFPTGQFYAGLERVDPAKDLGFEELLAAMRRHLANPSALDPAFVTDQVLRIGVSRLLWCITSLIWRVESCYRNFARRLGASRGNWRVVSFNWDILVEKALTEVGCGWAYSLRGAQGAVPVIKPHGSINWSSFAQNAALRPRYSGWQPIGPNSTLSYDAQHPLDNPDVQEINADLRYCIFPGDPDLPETHADLRLLWDEVRDAVRASERVVFIGYSLPTYDSYAGGLFRSACKGRVVEVCDPSGETQERFRDALGGVEVRGVPFRSTPYAALGSEEAVP